MNTLEIRKREAKMFFQVKSLEEIEDLLERKENSPQAEIDAIHL